MKVPRNAPCPCGSGRKYKQCCLGANLAGRPSPRVLAELRRIQAAEAERRDQFGLTRPVISMEFQGQKMMAVGSRIFYSPTWRTFVDFLLDYLPAVVGVEWMKAEAGRAPADRHPLLQLRSDFCVASQASTPGPDGLRGGVPSGPVAAYVNLAYDLYLLEHHQALQSLVVERMRDPNLYEAARYELFVAATCVRAGFKIEHEDETDRTRKHPEFIAVDELSDQRVAVEAKRRHRPVAVDRPQGRPPKADVGRLLGNALRKEPDLPYVVFIDLNLPPVDAPDGADPARVVTQVQASILRVAPEKGGRHGFNMLVFTNRPHRYVGPYQRDPTPWHYVVETRLPTHPLAPGYLQRIETAVQQYGRIPDLRFDETSGRFEPAS